jgi:shikimate kinase
MIPDKIFLIGFMGCGKTTHGKKLAKALEKPFIDLDNYIEKKEGMTIDKIFATKGEDYFREKESEYLKQVIARYPKSVVSLGGGAACFNNNISQILKAGIVIYIEMPAESLHYRLSQSETQRPLLQGKSLEESLEYIKTLLRYREPFYHQAQITVNGINLTTDKLKEALSLFIAKN